MILPATQTHKIRNNTLLPIASMLIVLGVTQINVLILYTLPGYLFRLKLVCDALDIIFRCYVLLFKMT